MKEIDVLVMSSSRPALIPYTINSFKRFVDSQCHCKLRYLLHEDFVFPESSNDVIKWAVNSGVFDVIEKHNPKIGLGPAMSYMFKKHIRTKYMFYLQDDWEFERTGIDLDRILWIMDRHPEINLILFNKYKNMGSYAGFSSVLREFDGMKLKTYNGWSFIPGIWRMNFIRNKWVTSKEKPEAYLNSHLDKKNIGIYFYGGDGENRWVRHLGNSFRMAAWQLKNGKPGGSLNYECREIETGGYYRAPWLPKIKARPTYIGSGDWGNDVSKETIEKLKKVGINNIR